MVSRELVDPAKPFAEVARRGIEGARFAERGGRRLEVAAPEVQLAAVGEHVLGTDGRRIAPLVQRAAGIEGIGGGIELAEIAQRARQVEQHLHLDPTAALPLLARRLLPDVSRPRERLHRLPGSMQLLEAVPAAEQAEMIGRERCERTIVPAERLGPLLLALKVPADRAVKDGGPTRRELGAAQQVALDLLLVAEHAEGPADLEEQLRGVPRFFLWRVVEPAVAGDDCVVRATIGERPDIGEDGRDVRHASVQALVESITTRPATPSRQVADLGPALFGPPLRAGLRRRTGWRPGRSRVRRRECGRGPRPRCRRVRWGPRPAG